MRRTEQRQGLRMLKLRDALSRSEASELSQLEAAELLGMSERTVRRWARRLEEEGEEEGEEGLIDRRLGRRSGRAVPDADRDDVERLYRERYKRLHRQAPMSIWSAIMASAGAIPRIKSGAGCGRRRICRSRPVGTGAAARGAPPQAAAAAVDRHAAASEPAPAKAGDGSRHASLPGRAPLDPVVTMDDATGLITSAILVEEEGTVSSFLGLAETLAGHGLPCSLTTDRGSHCFHTPEAGGKVAKDVLTRGRAGAAPARHRPHRGLFAGGAGPF